jgi:hypothetical protein
MLLTYVLSDFEIVPVAPIITGIYYYYYYYYYLKETYPLAPAIDSRLVGLQPRSQFIANSCTGYRTADSNQMFNCIGGLERTENKLQGL